ncbi:MAG: hypothetical protein ABIR38_00075 [Chthoniobacterales bacterium]
MSLRAKLGIFVLTKEEQRTIAFVVLALVLGLGTMRYRASHSQPATAPREEATPPASPSPAPTLPIR